jgi:hypothetical protein
LTEIEANQEAEAVVTITWERDGKSYDYVANSFIFNLSAAVPEGGLPAPEGDSSAPIISDMQPSGTLSSGTTQTTLRVSTHENATCRYSTSDVAYDSMANTFNGAGTQTHSRNISGLTDGSSYTYYVRCRDVDGNTNQTSTLITFAVSGGSGTLTLSPIDDTYIYNLEPSVDHNSSRLDVQREGRMAYLKFNVSSVPGPITSAALKMRLQNSVVETPVRNEALFLSNDSWTEENLTWNNAPFKSETGGTVLSTASINANVGTWHTWDVSAQAEAQRTGDGQLSIIIRGHPSDSQWWRRYSDKEFSGTNNGVPVLEVNYSAGDLLAPNISNGSPFGNLPAGTTQTTMSVSTNESATCRYSSSSGQSFGSMTNFSSTGGSSHSTTISGLSDGQNYTRYVKCRDSAQNVSSDYVITFAVEEVSAPGGLVGHWALNGNASDSSGQGNNGVVSGGGSYISGPIGQARAFNGSDSSIRVNHSASLAEGDTITVAMWVRGTTDSGFDRLMAKTDDVSKGFHVQLVNGGPDVGIRVDTSGGQRSANISNVLDGTWHHIAFVLDEGSMQGYKDGAPAVSNTYTHGGGFGNTAPLCIGNGGASCNTVFSDVDLDDVRIYNDALSGSEIGALYAMGSVDSAPPNISNGSPSGTLAAGTTQTTMSVTTNESASCRWSTASGQAFGSMTAFSSTGGTSHSTTISGLSDGQNYNRYVKCQDASTNTSGDYTISFSVDEDAGPSGQIDVIASATVHADTAAPSSPQTDQLEVQKNQRISYIKFNLSSVPNDIQSATLNLRMISSNNNTLLRAEKVLTDSWTESSVTWNNRPSTSGTAEDTTNISTCSSSCSWVTFDITALAQAEQNGDGIVSIAILTDPGSNFGWSRYRPRTTSGNEPFLDIDYGP